MKHITLLCRKINLTCPRICSWFINQSYPAASAAQVMRMFGEMYKFFDGWDYWNAHSVHANASRSNVTLIQKARFGIGDVYFLSLAYGLMNVVVGHVKRCSKGVLHLEDGTKIEADCVLKCTGCLGDYRVDRLLKIKELAGYWVNRDPRRVCFRRPRRRYCK